MSQGWVNFVGWFCFGCGVVFGAVAMVFYIALRIDRQMRDK